jgi:hypothetical protein
VCNPPLTTYELPLCEIGDLQPGGGPGELALLSDSRPNDVAEERFRAGRQSARAARPDWADPDTYPEP